MLAIGGRRRVRERYLVVYDGDYGRLAEGPKKYMHMGIGVEWAVGESADDLIVRRVVRARNPRGMQVVTSDGAVVRGVRAAGASAMSSREFLRMVKVALGESDAAEKPSSPSAAEVEKWLEIFGEKEEQDR